MTTSAELRSNLVCCSGDFERLPTHLEQVAQLVDVARLRNCISEEVARYEQFAGEGIGFSLDLTARPVYRVQEVMAEFVRDREAFSPMSLGGDDLDPTIDKPRTETAKAVDLDNLYTGTTRYSQHRNRGLGDVVLNKNSAGHRARVCRVSLLGPAGTTGDRERVAWPLVVHADFYGRGTAFGTLVLKAGGGVPAMAAVFLLGAAQIGHKQGETDYRPRFVLLTNARFYPAAELLSFCRRRFGDVRTVEGTTMNKKERRVFAEMNRLRTQEGLGEKLDRYRQSRDQYERLFKGHRDSVPAASLPAQPSRGRTSMHGRLRGIVGRND